MTLEKTNESPEQSWGQWFSELFFRAFNSYDHTSDSTSPDVLSLGNEHYLCEQTKPKDLDFKDGVAVFIAETEKVDVLLHPKNQTNDLPFNNSSEHSYQEALHQSCPSNLPITSCHAIGDSEVHCESEHFEMRVTEKAFPIDSMLNNLDGNIALAAVLGHLIKKGFDYLYGSDEDSVRVTPQVLKANNRKIARLIKETKQTMAHVGEGRFPFHLKDSLNEFRENLQLAERFYQDHKNESSIKIPSRLYNHLFEDVQVLARKFEVVPESEQERVVASLSRQIFRTNKLSEEAIKSFKTLFDQLEEPHLSFSIEKRDEINTSLAHLLAEHQIGLFEAKKVVRHYQEVQALPSLKTCLLRADVEALRVKLRTQSQGSNTEQRPVIGSYGFFGQPFAETPTFEINPSDRLRLT